MKITVKWLFSLLLILNLTACLAPKTQSVRVNQQAVESERSKQQKMALTHLQQLNRRLADTAWPLSSAALTFCEDNKTSALGILTASEFSYSEAFRKTARELFALDSSLQIIHITAGSPADKAGLKEGDIIVSVNGTRLPKDKQAKATLDKILAKTPGNKIHLQIKRDAGNLNLSVMPEIQCNYPILLSESDAVNAFADGEKVVITKGMMKFANTSQELSLVISHEIAHNVMSHITAKTVNSLGGTLLDIVASAAMGVSTQGMFGKLGAQMYSQEFESEADYVGLYIMARAGLDITGAEMFWRRMAVEHPSSINSNHTSTHPATAERFISIETTIEQIESKQQNGDELLPNMK